MAGVQVRGCCCGIPFGCGTLMFLGASIPLLGSLVSDAPLTRAVLVIGKVLAIFGLL